MDVTWDNSTATTLVITMVVNSYSRMLIAGYDTPTTGNNGVTGGAWPLVTPYKCDSITASTTSTQTAVSGIIPGLAKYKFGIVWANPTTTAIPKYDGIMQVSTIQLKCPATSATNVIWSTTESAYVLGTLAKDLKPSSISDISQDAITEFDNVRTLISATTNMCTE
jgi:hypothetical protein